MANVQQIIRDYLLRARSEGVAEVTAAASRLGAATDSLAVKTETQTRSQISAEKALERTALRMNVAYKTTNQMAQAEATLERARAQGLQGTPAYQAAIDGLAAAHQRSTAAANDNHSAFDRLGNMLTRRLIYAVLIREAKEALVALFNLNAELAKTGDIARRIGANSGSFQGIDFAATVKGVKDFPDAMLKFNDQVDRARAGLGDLGTLFRVNRITVGSTEDALLKVADLVKNAATEAQKFSILQQAGLPASREMARLMEQGADSIRKQAAEATKFTDDQLRRAQELDDKFNELWAGFVRGAKKAFLEIADFPQEGSTLRYLLDVAQGKKEFKIKFALQAEPGSILDRLTGGGGALPAIPVIPVMKGADLPSPTGTRLTVTPGGTTVDPARVKELLGLEQQRIGVLGQLASIEQQVRSVEIGIQLARLGGVKVTKDEETALLSLARAQALGTAQIRAQADSQKIEADTLFMSAGQAAAYRAVWEKVYEARRAGRPLNEQQIRDLQQEAAELARLTDLNATFKQLKDSAEQFTGALVNGLMDGKSLTDSLKTAFDGLAKGMANAAIKDLFSGNFEKAGVEAVIAVGAKLASGFFDDTKEKELQKAKLAFADMSDQVRNFNAAAEGFELSQFVTAIQQVAKSGLDLIKAAMAAGDIAAAIQLIHSGVKAINNQVDQFIRPKGNDVASQIANVNNEAQQIIGELNDLNARYGLGLNRTTEILAAAADHIAEIQRKAEEEINKRRLGFQDRFFNATNDNNSLAGQLAAFDRQAMREIIAERDVGGQALADLERAQIAERFNIVRDFNDKINDETRRAEQERLNTLNSAARNITDYLNNLISGPGAATSPAVTLANAQSVYNANLALAQGGDLNAQAKFTQLADNLDKAARAVYASADGYQAIRSQIIAQGLALPAVQQATDPTVIAVRDAITAIQATTAAVGGTTTAVGGTTAAVGGTTTAVGGVTTAVGSTTGAVNALDDSGTVLFQMKDFTSRVVAAINNHGAMSASAFTNLSDHLAHIRGYTGWAATHNAGSGTVVTGVTTVDGTIGGWSYTAAAGGGVIPPHGLGLVSEHLNPTWVRAGAEPITVTPHSIPHRDGANDNGAVVSELRALRSELAEAKREIASLRKETRERGDKLNENVEWVAEETAGLREVEEKGWKRAAGAAGRG